MNFLILIKNNLLILIAIINFCFAQSDQQTPVGMNNQSAQPSTQESNENNLNPNSASQSIQEQESNRQANIRNEQAYQVFENTTDYKYDPVGKRDPFRPFRDAKIGVGQIRAATRALEPLEKFDVKMLEVVAIVWDNSKPKALIQDPEKGIHSVIKGQRIGKNDGYIAEIREGEIIVVELFDLNGKIIKEPFIMCIDKMKGCGS